MKSRHAPAPALSKAWHFALMTGTPPQSRLPGWVELEQAAVKLPNGDYSWTAEGDRLWAQHGAALVAEATAHHFEPFWLRSRVPAGPGFRAWAQAFLSQHRY